MTDSTEKTTNTSTDSVEVSNVKPVAEGASQKGWYVLRAISGKEAKVKEVLEAAMRNTDLGDYLFQVLIPTEKIMTVKNGKKVVKEKNLYSGYVFIEANLTGEVQHELRNTTNVIDFLKGRGKDAKPERLRESEVLRMLGTADELTDSNDGEVNDYVVGETVKVNDGPFKGFNGEIDEVYPEKKKLKVMVKIFGRKTSLELDNSQVERE
ncbi:MAG: transcription termination/antitermination protein NusG [Muribaculaceae bacterium]|nr:transcription termination/antitermination protein NusG [Muribaculaceae bacterium]